MDKRPKIKLIRNNVDNLIEAMSGLILVSIWIITWFNYSALLDEIPVHFNAAGKIDGYGSKRDVFTLPIICTITSIAIYVLNKIPQIFNYPIPITAENAAVEYAKATKILRILSFMINLTFLIITIFTIHAAVSKSGLGVWLLPVIVGTLFFFALILMFSSSRK